jgi:hypothetical protein
MSRRLRARQSPIIDNRIVVNALSEKHQVDSTQGAHLEIVHRVNFAR